MRLAVALAAALAFSTSVALAGDDCPADVTGDGVVNVEDLTAVIVAWGTDDADADINGDGFVDVQDLTAVIVDWGCETTGETLTILSGTVTNMWTGMPIGGASVHVGDDTIMTDVDGTYSGLFPIGGYTVTFEATYFVEASDDIVLFPDVPATLDMALEPVAPVLVEIIVVDDGFPGGTVTALADVIVLDGSDILEYEWMQVAGADAIIDGADTDTVMLELASIDEYKALLFEHLREPPIAPEDLPPNVPPPPGEFPAGQQDRFEVVGVTPWAIEESGLVALDVEVTTDSGVYAPEDHGEIHTALPWRPAAGLRNVPVEIPVLLYGKTQDVYDWTLEVPGNSTTSLFDGETQTPEFTPDIAGMYYARVTDEASGELVEIEIFAGNWRGVITGEDGNGNPVSDAACVGCHQAFDVDMFTPWEESGHAEIFSQNLNTSTHYGPHCFACHTVGYDADADNNGIDEAVDYLAFLDSGLINNPSPDNWTTVLDEFPFTAQLANIQCENCHGPQFAAVDDGTPAHGPADPEGEPRTSLSSNVCATCHGEPLRHGRYQQWQLSGHANYELAIDESGSGNCSRCHTANGFLTWLPILNGDEPGDPTDSIEVTWTTDDSHPQTCVACHDPHMVGDSSGSDNNATVRIAGDTPPLIAGFTAYAVGRGAICMTCHNSRRGLRNENTWPDHAGTSEAGRAPHGSAQTDMIMGENAYYVQTGIRGNHSFLTDTCVQCHMEVTLPPEDLSYNQSGTNHTFYASNAICTDCHTGLDGPTIQAGVQSTLDILQGLIEDELFALIDELTLEGNTIDLNGAATITTIDEVLDIEFTEYHGRQAIIVTFTDQSVFGPYRVNDVDVVDADMNVLGFLYDFADDTLPKSGWNWTLVHNDGSLGTHNPTYAYNVMNAAITSLNPGMASAIEWPDWLVIQAPVTEKRR